jgi:hypothetical protein
VLFSHCLVMMVTYCDSLFFIRIPMMHSDWWSVEGILSEWWYDDDDIHWSWWWWCSIEVFVTLLLDNLLIQAIILFLIQWIPDIDLFRSILGLI